MAIHPDLVPLSFLLGRWEGAGIGGYPTIESFRFGQEVTFGHNGKPFLIYHSRTWKLDEEGNIGVPLGTESGLLRPRPERPAGPRLSGRARPGGPAEQALASAYDMAAMGQPLQPHLSAQLKRVGAAP